MSITLTVLFSKDLMKKNIYFIEIFYQYERRIFRLFGLDENCESTVNLTHYDNLMGETILADNEHVEKMLKVILLSTSCQ